MKGYRGLLVVAAATLVVLLVLVGIFIYLGKVNADRVKELKQSAKDNWTKIGQQADYVNASLVKVSSPADLHDVSKASSQMERLIRNVGRSIRKSPVPSGYKNLSDQQNAAVDALIGYLEEVARIASSGNEKTFQENSGILDSSSRKASSAVNEFLSNANFVRVTIPNDFYQAVTAIETAWKPPMYADNAEVQAVYDAANAFMNADIKESKFEQVWSMLSTRRIMALKQIGLTKEAIASGWRELWNNKIPVDYYLSSPSIIFSDPNTATIKAIVYMNEGSPDTETMRLFKENGLWKVETYPFVGWN